MTTIIKNSAYTIFYGVLWGWGDNSQGELDDIGSGDRLDPWSGPYQTTPIKLMTDVAAVCGGAGDTLALKTDGSLWSWGNNGNGELGYYGGDGFSNLGPQQTRPRQVLFGDGIPAPLETELFVSPGTTYVRLRDLAYTLRGTDSAFSVETWPGAEMPYLGWRDWYEPAGGEMAAPSLSAQVVRVVRSTFNSRCTLGVEYYHTFSISDMDGNSHLYVRLRDLANSHYFDVAWDSGRIVVNTGTQYTWSGERASPAERTGPPLMSTIKRSARHGLI